MGRGLIRIWRFNLRGGSLGEEASLQRSWNCFVCRCSVMEIKKVMKIIRRSRVGKPEATEAKGTLDRLHDAAEIIFQVADVADLGRIGRNHQQRKR
jgi:hypothetical protein